MEGVQTRNGLYGFEYLEPDERRVPEGDERKTYEIKALWQRNHEIVNLAVEGYKQTEIAEILNIHPQTVSNTLNSELGKRKLSEIRLEKDKEAKKQVEKIRVLTNKALDVYHEIFDNDKGEATLKDRKEAAKDVVMELSGLRSPLKLQSAHVNLTLTKDELESFKKRGIEAARESGMIIDAEATEITEGETE
jgi:predicted transcriptional regulator